MSKMPSEKPVLMPGERLDDLQRDGLRIIQNPSWFCFGMDAVLLSWFARVEEGQKCLDLGCGNGVIPILYVQPLAGRKFYRSGDPAGCSPDGRAQCGMEWHW